MKNIMFFIIALSQYIAAQDVSKNIQNLQDKINASTLIVEGRIVGRTSFWNADKSLTLTTNYIVPLKWFKGAYMDTVEMITLGGYFEGVFLSASHSFVVEPDHDYFFYLKRTGTEFLNAGKESYFPICVNDVIYINPDGPAMEVFNGRVYHDITNEVYRPLAKLLGTDYKVLRKNHREEVLARQAKIDSLYEAKRMGIYQNRGIAYDFGDARTYTHILPRSHKEDVLEFDVYLGRLGADKDREEKLVSSAIYIQYDTALLGANLYTAGLFTVEFSNVLKARKYNLTVSDTTPGMIKCVANIAIDDTAAIYPMEHSGMRILHCRVASKDVAVDFHNLHLNFNQVFISGGTSFYDAISHIARPYKNIFYDIKTPYFR